MMSSNPLTGQVVFQKPFAAVTQDKWQTTGFLVHFKFLFPLCLWRRASQLEEHERDPIA